MMGADVNLSNKWRKMDEEDPDKHKSVENQPDKRSG
jgi:hypothetical protein